MHVARYGCACLLALGSACAAPPTVPDVSRPATPIDTGPRPTTADPVTTQQETPAPPQPIAGCPFEDAFEQIAARRLEVAWLIPPSSVGTLRGYFEPIDERAISMTWEQRDERGRIAGVDDLSCGARGVVLHSTTADDVSLSFDPAVTVLVEPDVAGSSEGRALVIAGDSLTERAFEHSFESASANAPERWRELPGDWITVTSELHIEDGDTWQTETLWYVADDLLVPVRRDQRIAGPDGVTWERTEQADWWGLSQ